MGFFGFLKKEKVEPPKNPGATADTLPQDLPPPPASDTLSDMPKDDLAGIPPLPDAPSGAPADLPPGDASVPTGLLGDMPPPTDVGMPNLPPPPAEDASEMVPPGQLLDVDQPSETQIDPSHDMPGPVLTDLPPAPDAAPTPEMTPGPEMVPKEDLAAQSPEKDDDAETAPAADVGLPDFTDEEIATAERLEFKDELHDEHHDEMHDDHELPAFEEVEDAENLTVPQKAMLKGKLYVPALQYRDALKSIAAMRRSSKKGDAALKKLSDTVVANKDAYTQYAERLNAIQEQLIIMDNTLISQR